MANRRGKAETVTDFLFMGSKITVNGDCGREIRRWLLFGRKAVTNLDPCWKAETSLCQQGPYSQGYGLPSGHLQLWKPDCKKAEHQKINAFALWCWRRLFRAPWMARRSNQSILREINPEYSLERLMLKLKLQYFGHLMETANSLEKFLNLGD